MTTVAEIRQEGVLGIAGKPFPKSFSQELLLLLALVRVSLGTGESAEVRALCPGANWHVFQTCVERHRVGAFLHNRLRAEVRALLPCVITQRLEQLWRENVQRALSRAAELVRLVGLLQEAGIPVISLKGPLLSRELYGDIGLRFAGDIDLLVNQEDVGRADRILRAQGGYLRRDIDFELTPLQERELIRVRREICYDRAGLRMELGWRLELFPNSEHGTFPVVQQDLGGRKIDTFSAEANAHYLFVHAAGHAWFRLFWLVDASILMANPEVNWREVVARARRVQNEHLILQGARLARELFGITVPVALRPQPSEERIVAGLAAQAKAWISRDSAVRWQAVGFLREFLYRVRLHRSWKARLVSTRNRSVFLYGWKMVRMPDRWFRLHYLLGPFLCLYHVTARKGRIR